MGFPQRIDTIFELNRTDLNDAHKKCHHKKHRLCTLRKKKRKLRMLTKVSPQETWAMYAQRKRHYKRNKSCMLTKQMPPQEQQVRLGHPASSRVFITKRSRRWKVTVTAASLSSLIRNRWHGTSLP